MDKKALKKILAEEGFLSPGQELMMSLYDRANTYGYIDLNKARKYQTRTYEDVETPEGLRRKEVSRKPMVNEQVLKRLLADGHLKVEDPYEEHIVRFGPKLNRVWERVHSSPDGWRTFQDKVLKLVR